jgi:uncharacterized damage-inducible protein DinB
MHKLSQIFSGWDGYQTSLLHAVPPLTSAQLAWRPAPDRRSTGELVRHIGLGRITWLSRLGAPGMDAIEARIPQWFTDGDGARHVVEESVACDQAAVLAEWLTLSWQPIQRILNEWTTDDLFRTYPHRFRSVDYDVSHQWTLWRVMSHDLHHGGQLAMMLALQGVEAFELRALGGHIISPTLATPRISNNTV